MDRWPTALDEFSFAGIYLLDGLEMKDIEATMTTIIKLIKLWILIF